MRDYGIGEKNVSRTAGTECCNAGTTFLLQGWNEKQRGKGFESSRRSNALELDKVQYLDKA